MSPSISDLLSTRFKAGYFVVLVCIRCMLVAHNIFVAATLLVAVAHYGNQLGIEIHRGFIVQIVCIIVVGIARVASPGFRARTRFLPWHIDNTL